MLSDRNKFWKVRRNSSTCMKVKFFNFMIRGQNWSNGGDYFIILSQNNLQGSKFRTSICPRSFESLGLPRIS